MVPDAPARPRAYATGTTTPARSISPPSKELKELGQCASRLPHNQGPKLPTVSEAPAHHSTEVPMGPVVAEAPARPRAYFADGARGSRTTKGLHRGADAARGSRTSEPPRCRWYPRLPHILATEVPMVAEAPHDQWPILPMVVDGARGSRASKHQGADGARGSRTTKGLGCRQCPRLPHIQAPRCQWCPRLSPDQGLSLPMVSGAPAHPSTKVPMVPEAPTRPRAYATGTVRRSTDGTAYGGRGLCPGQPLLAQYHLPPKELKNLVNALPVSEAPAHHSTEVPMVSEAPHNQGSSLPMVSDAPAHPCTKVPMVFEAPAHPSIKVTDGV
ncbi:hypothetical protein V6Z12_D08G096000 [Gossypium hirsutum]